MPSKIRQWLEPRQADARALVAADEVNAYFEAQRRATRARCASIEPSSITGPRWPQRSPGSRAVVAEEEERRRT